MAAIFARAHRPTATPTAVEIVSFVRGFHDYKDIWCPSVGEILDLKREPTNPKDALAVCIQKDGTVVGHMPYNLAPLVSYFLERDLNTGSVEITGVPLNRGAGMGMEVPCIYRLVGPEMYVKRLKDVIQKDLDCIRLVS